jgi:hypothetical protein
VATPVAREQVLLFRVGESLYGIGIRGLWEVLSPEGITSLPTPQYQICTALAYRGRIQSPATRLTFGGPCRGRHLAEEIRDQCQFPAR